MTQIGRASLASCAFVLLGSGAAWALQSPRVEQPYEAAETCGTCHESIHLYWSESRHAVAASGASFLAAWNATAEAARAVCVTCHAPTALVTGDFELAQPISREGVSCDFCHTVRGVNLAKSPPFDLQPGPVKRGPLEYADSGFHETAYSTLHRSSALLCAGCHEYTNARGSVVLSTFSEWLASPYPARGETCQECHMPTVAGTTVKEELRPTGRRINMHRMSGADAAQLRRGISLSMTSFEAQGDSARAELTVTNSGVGHSTPGGLGDNRLVLVVGVENGAGEFEHALERSYRRVHHGTDGHEVVGAAALFLDAVAVAEDTRLKAGESRLERFTLPLAADWAAVVARLEYRAAGAPAILVTEERRARKR